MEAAPVFAKPRGAIEHEPPRFVAERAHRRLAADAVPALAARRDVARADVVAGRHGLDPRPDLLDHARGLVTEHDGQGMGRVARDHVQIAVADAVGRPPHLHFVGTGLEQLDVLHHDRLLHVVQNRRSYTHGALPFG